METAATTSFTKVLNPGTIRGWNLGGTKEIDVDVFVRVDWDGKRLSIGGVEGPMPSGNCYGSCGQIDMGYKHRLDSDDDPRYSHPTRIEHFKHGWDEETWFDLLDVWKRWHLNDMSPACEHQRALGWIAMTKEERTLFYWRLNSDTSSLVRGALKQAEADLRAGMVVQLTGSVRVLAALPDRVTTVDDAPPGPQYVPVDDTTYSRSKEVKTRGWLRPEDHPDGLLTKACPECGYAYGSEWRKEDVPDNVIVFLRGLPETEKQPAWV